MTLVGTLAVSEKKLGCNEQTRQLRATAAEISFPTVVYETSVGQCDDEAEAADKMADLLVS